MRSEAVSSKLFDRPILQIELTTERLASGNKTVMIAEPVM